MAMIMMMMMMMMMMMLMMKVMVSTIRGVGGDVCVRVGSVLELGARARGKFFFLFFSHRLCTMPFKKNKKQIAQNRVHARTPSPAPAFVFFFERPQSLGSLNSGPRRGMPLLSTSSELSSAALSSLESSFGLI